MPTPSRANKNRMPLELSISPTLTLRKRIAASDAGERRVLSSEDSKMMFNGRSAKPWGSFREGAANLDMAGVGQPHIEGHSRDHAGLLLSDDDD